MVYVKGVWDLLFAPGICRFRGALHVSRTEELNRRGAVYEGAVPVRFGNRKPPTTAYAGESPVLHHDDQQGDWVGGLFWDGRATGWTLGDPLAEQAQGPFLNPLEQNNPDARAVLRKVAESS